MKTTGTLSIVLLSLWWIPESFGQACIPGLTFYNKTNHLVLNGGCNQVVDPKDLRDAPIVNFVRARSNETYLLMLLESVPKSPDIFILHWLISGIKSQGQTLQTSGFNAHDLTSGYYSPVNQTHYEFRLYNMTGKTVWDTISTRERMDFFPSQWLAKKDIFSQPIARTHFSVRPPIPGPSGWVVTPYPIAPPQLPGQHPPQYPAGQVPPQYPAGQNPPQYPTGQIPPQYPAGQHPPQYPTGQLPPQFPTGQLPPQYPAGQQPPQYPAVIHPPPPSGQQQPHYPAIQNIPPNPSYHITLKSLDINSTHYSISIPNRPKYNPLIINSTIYTSEPGDKRLKLTPYLIINNKTYIWRNQTRIPGKGDLISINGTDYVPYNPSSKEIHHHHYHKNTASSFSFQTSLLTIPLFLALYKW